MNLKKWNDIKEDFRDALIIDNGASIAIHKDFNYPNLWGEAVKRNRISIELQDLADRLETGKNFEALLSPLLLAETINDTFKVKGKSIITKSYDKHRRALIDTVRDIHCCHGNVKQYLPRAADFLKHFQTVFSLNYDLLIYWAIMRGKNHKVVKDCFDNGSFTDDWEDWRRNNRTLVFYPHGGLQFARWSDDTETKLDTTTSADNLLEHVLKTWRQKSVEPLVVAEGGSKQKMRSIKRSNYLSTVYRDILPNCGPTLVIYGWSINKKLDGHLLRQIQKGGYKKVAVAVHKPSTRNIKEFMARAKKNIGIQNIIFFDAESAGCWIY